MPVYSYKCKDCGKEFDILVGVGEGNEELKCEKCGSKDIERLLSIFGTGSSSSDNSSVCTTPT